MQPQGLSPDQHFTVEINDRPSFVYPTAAGSVAAFGLNGPVTISVNSDYDIKGVVIRPKSLNLPYHIADGRVQIRVDRPVKFSLEINGDMERPLFVFANKAIVGPNKQKPADIIYKAGRRYNIGVVRLHSHQHVYIEPGAVVSGGFFADKASDIEISGMGIIDGKKNDSLYHMDRCLSFRNCRDIKISGITILNGTTWQIVPENCSNVSIENVKIVSHAGGDDGMDIVRSRDVSIRDCFIRTKDDCIAIKANGRYPDSVITNRITVENCSIWNGPWGNGFEIGFELDANEVKNVTFKDCDVLHVEKGAVFSIHNGSRARVHNILYQDIRIEDARTKLFDFSIFLSQYSPDAPRHWKGQNAIYMYGAWDGVLRQTESQKKMSSKFRGTIDSVSAINIKVIEGTKPYSIFCGFDASHKVTNVSICDLSIYGMAIKKKSDIGFFIENADNVEIY